MYLNGVATLAELTGASHEVVVEKAYLDGWSNQKPASLVVEDRSTIDDLEEYEYASAVVEQTADGTSVPVFFVSNTSTASIEGESTIGTFTIEGQVEFHDAAAPVVDHVVDHFEIGATSVPLSDGIVTLVAGADVNALASSRIGALSIGDGARFKLAERTGTPSHGTTLADVQTLKSLFIHKAPSAPTAVLDLTDNAMIIDYSGGSTPVVDVEDYITYAYNLNMHNMAIPPWMANNVLRDGINSSTAADVAGTSAPQTGIGYGEASDLSLSTWEGQTVDATSILVKYTTTAMPTSVVTSTSRISICSPPTLAGPGSAGRTATSTTTTS